MPNVLVERSEKELYDSHIIHMKLPTALIKKIIATEK